MVLSNNSIYIQCDLAARLARSGIELPPERIWTSALATAQFLDTQRPGGTAYAIGEAGSLFWSPGRGAWHSRACLYRLERGR
jgi:NagD protein